MAETKAVYKYWEVSTKIITEKKGLAFIFFLDLEYVEFQFHFQSWGWSFICLVNVTN